VDDTIACLCLSLYISSMSYPINVRSGCSRIRLYHLFPPFPLIRPSLSLCPSPYSADVSPFLSSPTRPAPSLVFIFQLLIFLIPLDSSTCHSFFPISLEVSFTMLPHSDLTQKKRKFYSPLCPLLFTRLQSSSVGIT
jgi:hypothetical protein